MKRIIKLTESDLIRIVRRVIKEQGPQFIDIISGASNFGLNFDAGIDGGMYGCKTQKSSYDLVIELFNKSKNLNNKPSTSDTQIKKWVSRIYSSMDGIGMGDDFTKVLSEIKTPEQLGAVLDSYRITHKNYLSVDLSGEYTISWDTIWNNLKKFQSILKIDSCAKYNTTKS
jgi:hypothetical protein